MSDSGLRGPIQATPEGGPLDEGIPDSQPGSGQVQSTPLASPLAAGDPLAPPTWREHMRGPILGLDDAPPSSAATPEEQTRQAEETRLAADRSTPPASDSRPPAHTSREETPSEELRKWPPYSGKPVSEVPWQEIARHAAPIVSQAEQLAIKGIDLSARSLSKLARYLESRREQR